MILGISATGLILLYKSINPAMHLFPKCPFLFFTGLQCPGCGSQRAVHHLLNAEVKEAFSLNPLLVISIPYIIIGYLFEILPLGEKGLRIRKTLYGTRAILVILIIVIGFAVWRNL
ncbi:MAG: DUF2752 domain-containing protein [Cyclobacteriaceae bacterium]|nr:DUF2752 domain-containing protein [Cyclobacteriaceae bacterium]